jgi:hypothetical protein
MHVTLPSGLAIFGAILGLANPGSAYVVTLWQNPDCTGNSRELNVWDNSCAPHLDPGWSAIQPKTYGSGRQRAYVFSPGDCGNLASTIDNWYADGGSNNFKIGRCLDLHGKVMHAAASYAA